VALALLAAAPAMAQRVGGYAGASLRTPVFAPEIALGGVSVPFAPDASTLFSNSSALAWIDGPTTTASWSSPAFGVIGVAALGAAMPVGRFAAVGAGVTTIGTTEQPRFDDRRQRIGSFSDRELGLVLGGALSIGPGSVGATLRMLRRGLSGYEATNTGYAVDLAGTLAFEERFYVGMTLANIAGEMVAGESTLRERIPWEARLSATYVQSLEERIESLRLDPSGTPTTQQMRPKAYVLGAAGVRMAQIDSLPVFALGVEAVPLATIDLGFRAGLNTSGEVSGGFLYRLPVEFARELRIDYAVRWHDGPGDLTHHVGLSAGF
jgi:hypothetical protein